MTHGYTGIGTAGLLASDSMGIDQNGLLPKSSISRDSKMDSYQNIFGVIKNCGDVAVIRAWKGMAGTNICRENVTCGAFS
jgi:hypothetical protein